MFQKFVFTFCLFAYFKFKIHICQDYCPTPVGSMGEKTSLSECKPLKELLKYEHQLNQNEYIFVHRSFLNTTIVDNPLVCCDRDLNLTKIFKNIGAEILRNQAELCGDNLVKRISFGEETTFMSYPWSALLLYDTVQGFHCGGTLITNRYVLTAAHCVNQEHFKLIGVRLREHNTTSEKDCFIDGFGAEHCYQPVVDVDIEKVIQHPGFSLQTAEHDIALIRLGRIIKFERSIRPICLPEYQNQEFDLSYGIITGWGATEHSKYSDVLLAAVVPIHDLVKCKGSHATNSVNSFKICAAGEEAGNEACKGDSGGPLILRLEGQATGRKFRYMQAGVITMGNRNCSTQQNSPTLFTKVSAYLDWISASIEL